MAIQTIEKRRCDRCGGHVANDDERVRLTAEGANNDVPPGPPPAWDENAPETRLRIAKHFSDYEQHLSSADLCKRCSESLHRWWVRPRGAP